MARTWQGAAVDRRRRRWRDRRRFGLLAYRGTRNLGDEIQSIAARHFLPWVDELVYRDVNTAPMHASRPLDLILNGWYTHRPDLWPPSPSIRPLITSFHLSSARDPSSPVDALPYEVLVRGPGLEFLRAHQPIGARDPWTQEVLTTAGVEAFVSGCLTLTLPPRPSARAHGRVVAVDVAPECAAMLRARCGERLLEVSHIGDGIGDPPGRFAAAERLLELYAGAISVVTPRLHAALPCLAMGVPVLFLTGQPDPPRVAGYLPLLHHATTGACAAGNASFDPLDPPPNADGHRLMADALARDVRRWVAACR
jgi:hypothetical protein